MSRWIMRLGAAVGATALVGAALLGGPGIAGGRASAASTYPVGNALTGYAAEVVAPTSSPPGVNVAGCRPGAAHPDPVVLLPGTFYNLADSWQALGPILANAGYCVYGLDYGANLLTKLTGGRLSAVGEIESSAAQLGTFVSEVLRTTGASKVDIVGWSQGGMMPRWYIEKDGGARYVNDLVGLAPSNHGTTLDGLFALINADTAAGLPAVTTLVGCTACTEQEVGSPFLQALNAKGDTVPGVRYTVIETTHDEVVTPYDSAFLSGAGVTNITLQDQCPLDATDHIGIPYDSAALQDVVNALGPDAADYAPDCTLALPVIGTP